MKQLIDNLHKSIEDAKIQAVSRKPDADREAAYLLGFLQGKFHGLNEALKIVEAFLNAEEQQEEFK